MSQKAIIAAILGIVVIGTGAWLLLSHPPATINSYEECVAAGYPILESYPEQCKTPDGRTFIHTIPPDFSDLIRVDSPQSGSVVASPLIVSGVARGNWFFEASFPVRLMDANNQQLAVGVAQAQGDWMTADFVPFTATLTFDAPVAGGAGTLILHNDNPSGLSENDKQIVVPVRFAGSTTTQTGIFGTPITMRVGDKVVFPNTSLSTLALKEINDSRCKAGVTCIWQGELSALFSATISGSTKELRLGTVNNKSVIFNGYTFTLQSATTESATVIVSVVPVASESGIGGSIHVGPTCPVERIPPDPNCADKPFANARIVIKNKASGAVVNQSSSEANGLFQVALVPGVYVITVSSPTNSSLPRCPVQEATVKAGAFTFVAISCDSGIR